MAMLPDIVVGAVVAELLTAVLDRKERVVKFKLTLKRLEETLNSIKPVIEQIEKYNRQLDRPKEETEVKQMQEGTKLVLECSEIVWWKCCFRPHYQENLRELDDSIVRFFQVDLQALMAILVKKAFAVEVFAEKMVPSF